MGFTNLGVCGLSWAWRRTTTKGPPKETGTNATRRWEEAAKRRGALGCLVLCSPPIVLGASCWPWGRRGLVAGEQEKVSLSAQITWKGPGTKHSKEPRRRATAKGEKTESDALIDQSAADPNPAIFFPPCRSAHPCSQHAQHFRLALAALASSLSRLIKLTGTETAGGQAGAA